MSVHKPVTKSSARNFFKGCVSAVCGTALLCSTALHSRPALAENAVTTSIKNKAGIGTLASKNKAGTETTLNRNDSNTLYMDGCSVVAEYVYYTHVPEEAETYKVISDIDSPYMFAIILPDHTRADMFDVYAYQDTSSDAGSYYTEKVFVARDVRPGDSAYLPEGTYGFEIKAFDGDGYVINMGKGAHVGVAFDQDGVFYGKSEWTSSDYDYYDDNTVEASCFISAATRPQKSQQGYVGQQLVQSAKKWAKSTFGL